MTVLVGRAVPKPILPVTDMVEATACYRALGFEVEAYDDGYAWVRHAGAEVLHLRRVDGLVPSANAASAYLHVEAVDGWHAAIAGAEAPGVVVGEVADMPWRMREFSFTDPSGNLVRVGSNL